jgi:class 3 adenylate cyclase
MEKNGIRKLAAIMFTDIEGYTSLVSKNEEQALEFVRTHRDSLTAHTKTHGGEVIEFYGDGSLSIYTSAVDAVECAIEMQKDYRRKDIIPVRIGIHLGDVVLRDGSVFGDGVNVASRIESMGVSGNILISEQVAHELKNKGHLTTKSFGRYHFKNVAQPIELLAIDHPDVVVPTKKQLSGPKGKAVNKRRWPLLILLIAIMALTIFYFQWIKPDTSRSEVVAEKISVPPFKNFTGHSELDYIGEMAAHWLTKELAQTQRANVVAFHTNGEIKQLASPELGEEINVEFAKQAGAINILEGTFSKISTDSLEFSSYINNLGNGQIKYTFDPTEFSEKNPPEGIKKLASEVKGYWDAKDSKLLSMPSFDAYKYYMMARNHYMDDDSVVLSNLHLSIQADSNFLDSYFLLIGYYYNHGERDQIADLIKKVEPRTSGISPYEMNILQIEKADLNGDNRRVYEIMLQDLEKFDRDFFTISDYMIFAINYMNNPAKAIEIFKSKGLDKLNLRDCSYCRTSHLNAALAYIRLEKWSDAESILKDVPNDTKNMRYYSYFIKLLSQSQKHPNIEQIVNQANNILSSENDNFVFLNYIAARELHNAGNLDLCKTYAKKILSQNHDNNTLTAWAHYFLEDLDSALSMFEIESKSKPTQIQLLSQIGVIHAKKGNKDKAESIIAELATMKRPYDYGAVPYHQARIYYHLGDETKALDLLQLAVNQGARFYANNVFDQDSDLQGLVNHQRFQRIIHPLTSVN